MTPFPGRTMSRLALALLLAPALTLLAGCDAPRDANGAMDSNLAARADEMDETANSRANAMAGGMMSDAANSADDGAAGNGDAVNDD